MSESLEQLARAGVTRVVYPLLSLVRSKRVDSFAACCEVLELPKATPGYTGGLMSSRCLYEDPETGYEVAIIALEACSVEPHWHLGEESAFTVAGVLHELTPRQIYDIGIEATLTVSQALIVAPDHFHQPWTRTFWAGVTERRRGIVRFGEMEREMLACILWRARHNPYALNASWDTLDVDVARSLTFKALGLNGPLSLLPTGQPSRIVVP